MNKIKMARVHFFEVGDEVSHPKYGEGIVTEADKSTMYSAMANESAMLVTVRFEGRERQVVLAEHDLTALDVEVKA